VSDTPESTDRVGLGRRLASMQSQVAHGRYLVPNRVQRHMARQQWSTAFLLDCVASLGEQDLHKTQQHIAADGRLVDIYRPRRHDGARMYIKVTPSEDGQSTVVLSFCRDGTAR
jgi:hypothetical protein